MEQQQLITRTKKNRTGKLRVFSWGMMVEAVGSREIGVELQENRGGGVIDSKAYKEYYVVASRAEPPKAKTKYKKKADESVTSPKSKTASTSKGTRLKSKAKVTKPALKKQPTKKTKEIGLAVLSEVALSEAKQVKLVTKRSRQTSIYHKQVAQVMELTLSQSNDEDDDNDNDDDGDNDNDAESDDHDDGSDNERTESDSEEIPDPNLTKEDQTKYEEEDFDEGVRTPSDNEFTDEEKLDDEETIDAEEDDEVLKELYEDMNVNLEKGDAEMTDANQKGLEQLNVSQESGFEQEEEDAYATLTPLSDAQKADEPVESSFVSFYFTSKFLNLENPSPANNEIASLMETSAPHATAILEITFEAVNLAVQLQTNKLRKEAQAENQDFLNQSQPHCSHSGPHGIIYVDLFKRKRLMRTDELHKFSDGTLNDVRSALHDIVMVIRIEYLQMRKWKNLDKKRDRVMVQEIDNQLYQRSDEVLKLKNFKKDALLKLFKLSTQVRYEHVGLKVTSAQDGGKRLCLVEDLKKLKIIFTSRQRNKIKPKAKRVKRPAKKYTTVPIAGVAIKDTLGVSVSKKKAPTKADRSKGIEILYDVALSKATQLKEATKRSKKDFYISQASGSGDGTDFESGVPDDEDDNDDDSKGDDDKADSDNDGNSDADDNERTDSDDDDENPSFTLKDYNEEEHDEEYKYDDDNENVFEEEDDDLYDDVDTDDSKQSSFVSSDFANQFIILEKALPSDHEVASLMNKKISHEVPGTQIPSPLTELATVIPDSSTIASITVPPTISMISPLPQLTPPSPAPTTIPTTTSIPTLPDFSSLFGFDQRVSTLETELSQLKQAELFAQVLDYITINESLENVMLAKSSSQPKSTYEVEESLTEFELKKILLDKMEKNESYKTAPEHKELYEGLVKSYKLDKDLFSSYGNVYSLKRDCDDKDKDEDPSPKSFGKSVQAEPVFETADTEIPQDQGGDTKDQPNVEATPMDDWFKKPNKPLTPDRAWNDGKVYKAVTNQLDWNNPEGHEYPFDLLFSLIEA
nr:hypothetical protein [Tanacetum cinerariifolium]